MIQISNIKVPLNQDRDKTIQKNIVRLIGRKAPYKIIRESIDARQGIVFVYSVQIDAPKDAVSKNSKISYSFVEEDDAEEIFTGDIPLKNRPIIIGFGPAGIFAALELARNGYRPIVFEQGNDVDTRSSEVELFWSGGGLNPMSNVQFGEGGAGAFSDGKLTTRIKNPYARKVIRTLHQFGAPEEIVYANKPHIGTDILVNVVKNLRQEILRLGGEIHFGHKLDDLFADDGEIRSVRVNGMKYDADAVIFAIGHSARDTIRLLCKREVELKKKPFAVGFRIEHPQILIDKAQYKENYDHPKLKASEYFLTHTPSTGRGCYTFCMCPGGRVIASSSDYDQVVVNGMSYHARDLTNANSAILCSVLPEDFEDHPLAAMEFQERIEKQAFELGGRDYYAPVQRVGDYLRRTDTVQIGEVIPSYLPGYRFARLDLLYPEYIYQSLSESIREMGRKLTGFDMEDAILSGVETRTSSPVRIVRNENLESANVKGLYPCGEGAGYAGGIVSAAVDGIRVAQTIMRKYYLE